MNALKLTEKADHGRDDIKYAEMILTYLLKGQELLTAYYNKALKERVYRHREPSALCQGLPPANIGAIDD